MGVAWRGIHNETNHIGGGDLNMFMIGECLQKCLSNYGGLIINLGRPRGG